MRKIVFPTIFSLILFGCASSNKAKDPTSFMYAAEGTISDNLNTVKEGLESLGYQVRRVDQVSGSLSTERKSVPVSLEDKRIQELLISISVYQDRGSLKLSMSYLCSFKNTESELDFSENSLCPSSDPELNKTIQEIEQRIDQTVAQSLKK